MFNNKIFTGLALEGNIIRVAQLKKVGKTLHLVKLDRFTLVDPLEEHTPGETMQTVESNGQTAQQEGSGDIFGLDEPALKKSASGSGQEDEFVFEEMEEKAKRSELESLDMTDEVEDSASNTILLHNIITRIDEKKVQLGINVPAGDTIFQISDYSDFNEVKAKDLVEVIETKLESVYGEPKSTDHYSYKVRDDGSLILASIKEEAPLLTVVNKAKDLYNGKIRVRAVYPDEVALVAMVRANYQLNPSEVTLLVQFGADSCRFLFMKGEKIHHVAPVITQGTRSGHFLNTVFSKILFELDSGKVSGIDQIILANNTIGKRAVEFFSKNFPDITVQPITYNPELFQYGEIFPAAVDSFSNAIALGWAAAKTHEESFPELSFLPTYVEERQQIFKLQWHGIILLCLIFFAPLTFNYFYQQNSARIESLNSELDLVSARSEQLTPIVEQTTQISQNLTLLTSKLALLDSLSTGSKAWSAKLAIINRGMDRVPNSWYTSMTKTQGGTFVEGYTLYRNRIPAMVDIYAEATLLNVSIAEIRGKEIFRFSILVKEFAEDPSVYSPDKPENIQQILSE